MNLKHPIDTLAEKIADLKDDLEGYKVENRRLVRDLEKMARDIGILRDGRLELVKRNRRLSDALCDIADGNYRCWKDIQADTGLGDVRCQEIYDIVTEEIIRND